jgi:hypothetical protein
MVNSNQITVKNRAAPGRRVHRSCR